MKILFDKIFLEHDTGAHPENKSRLISCGDLPQEEIKSGEDYLPLVHTAEYISKIKQACAMGGGSLDPDTIVSKKSYEAAIYAVGATVMASENGDFALCRPPGHHAYPSRASGFCLFNNIAIAAKKLANEGKKVLIVDFDGHCGDGTERIFYDSNEILYWSLHQYPAFPGIGNEDEIGAGKGEGFTINVPLPPGSGDDLFWKAVESILPIARQFAPDVVAVSAGFDAHQSDFLLDLHLSATTYYRLGVMLREEFGNVFATLEGGYNVDYLPRCINNFVNGVNGERIDLEEPLTESSLQVRNEFEARMSRLNKNLSRFWKIGT